MYLRWKVRRYELQHSSHHEGYFRDHEEWETYSRYTVTRSLSLVQNERVGGNPRQRVVAYLGNLNESRRRRKMDAHAGLSEDNGESDLLVRRWFWRDVQARLDALVERGTITPTQRDGFVAQIGASVERPSEEQVAIQDAEHQQEMAAMKGMVR